MNRELYNWECSLFVKFVCESHDGILGLADMNEDLHVGYITKNKINSNE